MKRKIGIIVKSLCLVAVCTVAFMSERGYFQWSDQMGPAAERLYSILVGFEFDGIEVHKSENRLSLYKYVVEEDSSARTRKEVASLSVDDASIQDAQLFRNIMDYCGGIFFATDLNWDGEWSGLCLYPSDPSLLPSQYVSFSKDDCAYWLSGIPDSVVNR